MFDNSQTTSLSVHRAMEVCTIGTHPAHAQVPTCPLGQGTPSTWLRPSARRQVPGAQVPGAQVPGAQVRVPLRHCDEPFEAPGKKWPTHPLCTLHSVHSALCALPYFPYSLIPYSLFPIPLLSHSPTLHSPTLPLDALPRPAPSARRAAPLLHPFITVCTPFPPICGHRTMKTPYPVRSAKLSMVSSS